MCIAFFYFTEDNFIVTHNREEYNRETLELHNWEDYPDIYGSKDLKSDGLCFGISKSKKRFVALTNIIGATLNDSPSRGLIARNLLLEDDLKSYLSMLKKIERCSGFNVIVGSMEEGFYFYNSLFRRIVKLKPYVMYSLSNLTLNFPSERDLYGKEWFIQNLKQFNVDDVFKLMSSYPIWVNKILFKTRNTSILLLNKGKYEIHEKNYYWFGSNYIKFDL